MRGKKAIVYRILIVICGLIMLVGFFLFPVLNKKQTNGQLKQPGSRVEKLFDNANTLTEFNVVFRTFSKSEGSSGAEIMGYKYSALCFILFSLPVAGAIMLIIYGCIGKMAGGVGAVFEGAFNIVIYVLQRMTLPKTGISDVYKFTFWLWVLMAVAAAATLLGILLIVKARDHDKAFSEVPYEGYHNEADYDVDTERTVGVPGYSVDFASAGANDGNGALCCLSGEFAGAVIPVPNGTVLSIGRNTSGNNLILSHESVSRIHCYVSYLAESDTYRVRDVSTFGVFLSDF